MAPKRSSCLLIVLMTQKLHTGSSAICRFNKTSPEKINCILIDTESIVHVDVTGADTLSELIDELKKEDIETYIARA